MTWKDSLPTSLMTRASMMDRRADFRPPGSRGLCKPHGRDYQGPGLCVAMGIGRMFQEVIDAAEEYNVGGSDVGRMVRARFASRCSTKRRMDCAGKRATCPE